MKSRTYSAKISRSFSSTTTGKDWDFRIGIVATPICMVRIYSQGGKRPFSSADFIYEGRHYHRTWQREITDRGLAILANRFVWDVRSTLSKAEDTKP